MNSNSVRYFAAANSCRGFYSLFGEIFSPDEFRRIYIIKGCAGTGKSTFMKKVGEEAEAHGLCPEYVLCGSDPESLDGLIIPELSVAFIDGTSPHVTEPVYPLAVERVIDLYGFADAGRVSLSRFAVMEESALARREMSAGYGFLRVAGELTKESAACAESVWEAEKADAAAGRIVSEFSFDGDSGERAVFGEAICHLGTVSCEPYFGVAEKRVAIEGKYGAEKLFLRSLCNAAHERGVGFSRVLSALVPDTVTGVYFPEQKTYFSIFDEKNGDLYDKRINAMRFIDAEKLALCRGKLRFYARFAKSLSDEARGSFARAREHHSELERIYGATVDFSGIDSLRGDICRELFGNLQKFN